MRRPAIFLFAMLAAVPAKAADLAAGRQVFARCRICHRVAVDAPNGVGPNLHGVFGRKAGSLGGYDYSPAMQRSGVVWTDQTLARFLRDPKTFIPGNRMGFPGLDDTGEIENLLAYLKQATD